MYIICIDEYISRFVLGRTATVDAVYELCKIFDPYNVMLQISNGKKNTKFLRAESKENLLCSFKVSSFMILNLFL